MINYHIPIFKSNVFFSQISLFLTKEDLHVTSPLGLCVWYNNTRPSRARHSDMTKINLPPVRRNSYSTPPGPPAKSKPFL